MYENIQIYENFLMYIKRVKKKTLIRGPFTDDHDWTVHARASVISINFSLPLNPYSFVTYVLEKNFQKKKSKKIPLKI